MLTLCLEKGMPNRHNFTAAEMVDLQRILLYNRSIDRRIQAFVGGGSNIWSHLKIALKAGTDPGFCKGGQHLESYENISLGRGGYRLL